LTADISNWRTPPFNEWAFQHVPQLIPCATIDNDPAAARPLPHEPLPLDGFRLPMRDGAFLDIEQFLRATRTDGFAVLHRGRIVFEFYDHGMTAGTPHILMSATKSIAGLIAGLVAYQGLLNLEAPISEYVREVARTAYRGATVRHLLDMRAGVEFDDEEKARYEASTGWNPAHAPDMHAYFAQMKAPVQPHGGPFRYRSSNTDLLGWVLERAAGEPFATLVSELLWKPMRAEHPACITVDSKGAPRCTGGLCATTRDFARIGHFMMTGGVPASWIDDVANNGDREAWKSGDFAGGFRGLEMTYRGNWYVIHNSPTTLFAMGIHGQNLLVDRDHQIVIAKFSSQALPLDLRAVPLTHRAIPEIRRCLLAAM
jgi:CubicO group peptidase (beta-lactamase class C family)